MKVILVFFALLISTAGAFAKTSNPVTLKRYTCLTSYMYNNSAAEQDHRFKYNPEFIRFRFMGKDVADIVDLIASYDVRESPLPKDTILNHGGSCDYGKDIKGKIPFPKRNAESKLSR